MSTQKEQYLDASEMEDMEGASTRINIEPVDVPGSPIRTETSISFLDLPWGTSTGSVQNTILCEEKKVDTVHALRFFPDSVDPLFSDVYIEAPEILRDFLGMIVGRCFVYCIGRDRYLTIRRCKSCDAVFRAAVADFSGEEFAHGFETRIVFVLGRGRYKNAQKLEQDRTYKASVIKNVRYERGEDRYRHKMQVLYGLQIRDGTNFVFVETSEDLNRELKIIARYLTSDKQYVPKVRTYPAEQKGKFLANVLENIPGISRSVAISLAAKFKTLRGFCEALKRDTAGDMARLEIVNEEEHSRRLGGKQLEKLRTALLSTEEDLPL
jgi:hypothetical protein